MRLLSSTLLLSIALSSLGAPTTPTPDGPRTSIETYWENVTKTRIHTITDPTPVVEKPACSCDTVTTQEATVAADAVVTSLNKCSCEVFETCRTESLNSMDSCMTECNEHITTYGNKTEDYRKCFTENNATIVEAETCLFKDMKDHCTAGNTTETIQEAKWDAINAVKYHSESKDLEKNTLWTKNAEKYEKMQTFFHCTKNCIHKKLQSCTAEKKCALQLPEATEFGNKMIQCTKKSLKISNALLNTCTCLAWTNGVKDLQGACAVLGNSYYVDRA